MFEAFRLSGSILLDAGNAVTQLRNFNNSVEKAANKLKSVGSAVTGAGTKMSAFITVPILAGIGAAIKGASDMNETVSKTGIVFGKSADEILKWSDTTLKKIGLAKGTALDMAAVYGDMGTSMGLTAEQAKEMSINLVNLTGDMASFKNLKPDEIHIALTSAYTGETETLKRLGIVMLESNLKEFARAQGIKKSYKEMTQGEKVMLRYKYIQDAAKNSIGDFQRTQDSAANQMRIFTEGIKETGSKIGAIFLPYFQKAITFINGLIDKFRNLPAPVQKIIIIFGLLAGVVGPLVVVIGTLITFIGGLVGAIGAIGAPAAIAIAAIIPFIAVVGGAITTIGILIYKTGVLQKAFNLIKNIFIIFSSIIKGDVNIAINLLTSKFGYSKEEATRFTNKVIYLKDKIIEIANRIKDKFIYWLGILANKIKDVSVWIYEHRKQIMLIIETLVTYGIIAGKTAKKIYDAIKTVITIGMKLNNLAKDAYKWGTNMIQGFINGIKSKIQDVKNAVSNVAQGAKDLLGFKSPTKEGPGKDSDTWAPNLIDMFADGIIDNSDKVKNAALKLANELNFGNNIPGEIGINARLSNVNGMNGKTIQLIINNPQVWQSSDVERFIYKPFVDKLQRVGARSY